MVNIAITELLIMGISMIPLLAVIAFVVWLIQRSRKNSDTLERIETQVQELKD